MCGMKFCGAIVLVMTACFVGCDGPAPSTTSVPSSTVLPSRSDSPVGPKWQTIKDENQLDHKVRVAVSYGGVVVRCAPKLEAYFSPHLTNLGRTLATEREDHGQKVRYRINDEAIRSEYWSGSTDFTALFPPSVSVKRIIRGQKLTLEYTPEYEVSQTEVFDLSGLQAALQAAGCKI